MTYRYRDTHARFPHLANAAKYAIAQSVVLFGAFHQPVTGVRTRLKGIKRVKRGAQQRSSPFRLRFPLFPMSPSLDRPLSLFVGDLLPMRTSNTDPDLFFFL